MHSNNRVLDFQEISTVRFKLGTNDFSNMASDYLAAALPANQKLILKIHVSKRADAVNGTSIHQPIL